MNGFMYDYPAHDVTRDFFFNAGDSFGLTKWGIVVLFAGAFCIFLFSLVWKMSIWARGGDFPLPGIRDRRIRSLVKAIFFPKDFLREWYPGLVQLSFVWGFSGLALCIAAAFVQEYITSVFFGVRFLSGYLYMAWSLVSDLSSVLLLTGVGLAVFRRMKLRPSRLDTTFQDVAALVIVAAAGFSGLLVNALRISISDYPGFEGWSFASWLLSLPLSVFNYETLLPAHLVMWWVHILSACVFIAFAGIYKTGRFAAAGMNIYCSELPREGKAGLEIPPAAVGKDPSGGAACVDDFTWKQMMDLDACVRCGRCQDHCPAYLSDLPLSPKRLIGKLSLCLDDHNRFSNGEPLSGEMRDYVTAAELWTCTGCGACMESCPSRVDHVTKVTRMRCSAAFRESAPTELRAQWKNIEEKGNRFGRDDSGRGNWMSADNAVPFLAEKNDVEYLFFAGCASAFDPEAKKSANAFLSLMRKAGVSVGVLGLEEKCCGDFALRTGNEELFLRLAADNLRSFTRYGVKKIVVSCPHGYNLLQKEYRMLAAALNDPEIRADYEIVHHSQLISSLVAQGKIRPVKRPAPVAVFSDPCFLGRYNHVYDEPRSALQAVPGLMLVDAVHSREKALCCGGPLSLYSRDGAKMGEFRAREVHQSGARAAVTACPSCRNMIRNGLSEISVENIRTLDIAEFMLESCGG